MSRLNDSIFCECGAELNREGECTVCAWNRFTELTKAEAEKLALEEEDGLTGDSEEESAASVGPLGDYVIRLPYGFMVDCVEEYIYNNIKAEAENYEAEGDVYQRHDWSDISDLLRTKVLIYIEENTTQKRQLSSLALQQQRALGATRQQRLQEYGTGRSMLDILRDEYERMELYCDQHAGEFDWRWTCPSCNLSAMHRQDAPHPMFDYGGGKDDVWVPEFLPLIKRYYAVRGKDCVLPKSAVYTRSDWMDRPEWDGGMSIPDAARILNMSPVGVLYAIWAHSRESGNQNLPSLLEMVGFTFDIDKPDSLQPYLPEGNWNSKDFLRDLHFYQTQKKSLKNARAWRKEHAGLMLAVALKNRLLFSDYFGPRLCRPIPWRTWWAQMPSTIADTALERDGRGTGKSERVKLTAIQSAMRLAMESPGDCVLVATPDEQHTRPHYQKVITMLDADPLFSLCLETGNKKASSRHGGEIHFVNDDCTIYFRFPGKNTKDAFSLQQYHASALIVDEAGFWPAAAERAITSSLNTQRCICQKYFGVVIQEEHYLPIYYYSRWPDRYTKFRNNIYSMPSLINIYDYNLKKHREQLEILGGSVFAEAYARQVLGMLGEPTEIEFRSDELDKVFVIEASPYEDKPKYRYMGVSEHTFNTISNESQFAFFKGMSYWPGKDDLIKGDPRRCMFGFDYGKSAPSQLWVLAYNEDTSAWRLVYRVTMTGVKDDDQIQIIDHLDTVYNPYRLAMDTTGTHNQVAAILTSGLSTSLAHKKYPERIWRVGFRQDMIVRYWDEPPSDLAAKIRKTDVNGVKLWAEYESTNVWVVGRMHRWFQEGRLELPKHDEGLRREFSKFATKSGKWVGEDHNIAALSTFLICHWNEFELKPPDSVFEKATPKLVRPVFFDPNKVLGPGALQRAGNFGYTSRRSAVTVA